MADYSFVELADMHLVYGACNGNSRAAQRLLLNDILTGGYQILAHLFLLITACAKLVDYRGDTGRPRTVRTPEFEENILDQVHNNPSTSSRHVGHQHNADHTAVWRVWHEQQLYPFHPQKVQALQPADYAHRIAFCQWYLQRCAIEPQFGRLILFTDEATFTRDGIFNSHNQHVWADVNPKQSIVLHYQQRFSVNIWAGVVGDYSIGPVMLPLPLNGAHYLQFLRHTLPELLQDVPLDIRRRMWYQHDGATPHFTLQVRGHLRDTFGENWIGRGGPIAWPARSPDLTPLDFFVWGHLKSLVYETPVVSEEDLVARILVAADQLQQNPGVFHRMREALSRRCTSCIEAGGRTFEQYL